jgi:hypothetical protein
MNRTGDVPSGSARSVTRCVVQSAERAVVPLGEEGRGKASNRGPVTNREKLQPSPSDLVVQGTKVDWEEDFQAARELWSPAIGLCPERRAIALGLPSVFIAAARASARSNRRWAQKKNRRAREDAAMNKSRDTRRNAKGLPMPARRMGQLIEMAAASPGRSWLECLTGRCVSKARRNAHQPRETP